jgi:chain length determinant protein tyrosine kinase EpsG
MLETTRVPFGPSHYEAPEAQRLGEWLCNDGVIDLSRVDEINAYGAANNIRFGEAALQLGHITRDDLERALAAQFDDTSLPGTGIDEALIVYHDRASAGADEVRSLRNTLALRWFKHPQGARTLAVMCPTGHEDGAVVAGNLAIAFAQVGFRTLLIDGNMREPKLHQLFRIEDRSGLAAYLAGRPEEAAFFQIDSIPNLTVIPVGGIPPNPQELLLRGLLHDLLRRAEQQWEVILVSTPPADLASDYLLIGAETMGGLIVAESGQTRARDAAAMVRQCQEFGIRLVGAATVQRG